MQPQYQSNTFLTAPPVASFRTPLSELVGWPSIAAQQLASQV